MGSTVKSLVSQGDHSTVVNVAGADSIAFPSLPPSRKREGGLGRPPSAHYVSAGRFCRVKGPSPRCFASAGRTNPLTRHTLLE